MGLVGQRRVRIAASEPWFEVPPSVTRARRHARAYRWWAARRGAGRCPGLDDVDPRELAALAPDGVMVALGDAEIAPRILWIAEELARSSGIDPAAPRFADLPRSSFLVRLIRQLPRVRDHGGALRFEADGPDLDGSAVHHAGILLPFHDADGGIAFVFAAIERRSPHRADATTIAAVAAALRMRPTPVVDSAWEGPAEVPRAAATLPDLLSTARTWAALARDARPMRVAGLRAALGAAHDLLLSGAAAPQAFARWTGMGDRTPRAAVIRLVWGDDAPRRDRATYAAVLAYARRLGLGPGMLTALLERVDGGVEAIVAAERTARRQGDAVPVASPASTAIMLAPLDDHDLPGDRLPTSDRTVVRAGTETPFGRIAG